MESLNHLRNNFEKAEYFQDLLIDYSTGGSWEEGNYSEEYKYLRNLFLEKPLLPGFIRKKRDIKQFWIYIKGKIDNYAGRREYIYTEFSNFLETLESSEGIIHSVVREELQINSEGINQEWEKAIGRKGNDPEGAITMARTLLESTLKSILDSRDIVYSKSIDFSELYKLASKELDLSADGHDEKIFKQILGGCSGIVNGLAQLRNNLGDSHGGSKVKPSERHAELAVNLSGAMSTFLFKSHNK